jgi:hypothetical protein
LSIVRISKNQKTQRFRNWICFRLQARGEHLLYRKTKSLSFYRSLVVINGVRVFENRVLRRIFGPKRDEVTGGVERTA